MVPFASEGGIQIHLPEGLWPVYVAAGGAVICVLASAILSFVSDPTPGLGTRMDRVMASLGGALLLVTVGLYVYADERYQDCRERGNHPWWTDHVEPGKAICDRAVFGDTVVYRPR